MCDEYNGKENYETWAVELWFNNDEGLYHQAREAETSEALYELAREVVSLNNMSNGLASDLLTHALQKVDWNAIWDGFQAEKVVDDEEESDEEDEEVCQICGKKKERFMHNCPNSVEYTEKYGCPLCDDKCDACK